MASDWSIVYLLAGFTMIAGIGIALWQLRRVRRADEKNEHSALTHDETGPGG